MQEEARKRIEEEQNTLCQLYLEDNFKHYVKEKYEAKDPALLGYPQILQMIFALEWYDVPRKQYRDLV